MKKLTPSDVAKITGIPVQTVRVLTREGALPFGTAVKTSSRYQYVFSPSGLATWTGKSVEQLEEML